MIRVAPLQYSVLKCRPQYPIKPLFEKKNLEVDANERDTADNKKFLHRKRKIFTLRRKSYSEL